MHVSLNASLKTISKMSDADLAIKELINDLDKDNNRNARIVEALKGLLERIKRLESRNNNHS
jgi:hypothetical protein